MDRYRKRVQTYTKKDYLSNKWPFLEFCKFAHDVSDRSFINYFVLVVINAYKMKRTTT